MNSVWEEETTGSDINMSSASPPDGLNNSNVLVDLDDMLEVIDLDEIVDNSDSVQISDDVAKGIELRKIISEIIDKMTMLLNSRSDLRLTIQKYDTFNKLFSLFEKQAFEMKTNMAPNAVKAMGRISRNNTWMIKNIDAAIEVPEEHNELIQHMNNSKVSAFFSLGYADQYTSHTFVWSDRNVIFATSDIYGSIYVDVRLLELIIPIYGIEKIESYLKTIVLYISKKIKEVNSYESLSLSKDDLVSVLYELYKKIDEPSSKLTSKERMNLFYKVLRNKLQHTLRINLDDMIKSATSNAENSSAGNFYSITASNRLQQAAILNLINKMKTERDKGYKDGIQGGLSLFVALYQAGYNLDSETGMCYKNVNIVPKLFYRNERLYRIKEECRIWKVEKLTINPQDFISCTTHVFPIISIAMHPNIDGGKRVCVGNDLPSLWLRARGEMDSKLMVQFLKKLEETLEIINFDSSYTKPGDYKEITDIYPDASCNSIAEPDINVAGVQSRSESVAPPLEELD